MGRRSRRKLQQAGQSAGQAGSAVERFHDSHYKTLLFIPLVLALLSVGLIAYLYLTTGDYLHRGISIKGGTSYTFAAGTAMDASLIEERLGERFPEEEFTVRELGQSGQVSHLVVETSLTGASEADLVSAVGQTIGTALTSDDYAVEEVGSSMGENFFGDLAKTLLFAFLLMGAVVLFYFRTPFVSLTVIVSALFDLIITLGVINLLQVKLSTAGVAAFLMLLGYSIDTNALLTARVLKRPAGATVFSAIVDAFRTGMTMIAAGLSATIIAYVISESPVVKQIMLILIIGLLVDILTAWVQNAGLLRWHLEGKQSPGGAAR